MGRGEPPSGGVRLHSAALRLIGDESHTLHEGAQAGWSARGHPQTAACCQSPTRPPMAARHPLTALTACSKDQQGELLSPTGIRDALTSQTSLSVEEVSYKVILPDPGFRRQAGSPPSNSEQSVFTSWCDTSHLAWTCYLGFLNLSSLICEMGIVMPQVQHEMK